MGRHDRFRAESNSPSYTGPLCCDDEGGGDDDDDDGGDGDDDGDDYALYERCNSLRQPIAEIHQYIHSIKKCALGRKKSVA